MTTAPQPVTGRRFEDFLVGEVFRPGELVLSRGEIVGFAAAFDPQPFHLDEAAAARSLLGGLSASGWHVAVALDRVLWERLLAGSAARRVEAVPQMRWARPVMPERPLALQARVLACEDGDGGEGVVTIALEAREDGEALAAAMTARVALARALPAEDPSPARRAPAPAPAGAMDVVAGSAVDPRAMRWLDGPPEGVDVAFAERALTAEEAAAFRAAHAPAGRAAAAGAPEDAIHGWHLGCAWMRAWADYLGLDAPAADGEQAGPAAGLSDIAWHAPVRPGEPLVFASRLEGRRASASRPGWGLHFRENQVRRAADGAVAMRFRSTVLVRQRLREGQ